MKQSNWILGAGVLVAIILIITTIYVKANSLKQNDLTYGSEVSFGKVIQTLSAEQLGKISNYIIRLDK